MAIREITSEEREFLKVKAPTGSHKKTKSIVLNIPQDLFQKIHEEIDGLPLKKPRTRWILEAIEEKLSKNNEKEVE